jgi:hypothetical protein
MSNVGTIEECPLGRALRDIREKQPRAPRIDWSRIPLGQFYEAHACELAKHRNREAIRVEKQRERARRLSLAKRRVWRPGVCDQIGAAKAQELRT